jgi:hypothetical protein
VVTLLVPALGARLSRNGVQAILPPQEARAREQVQCGDVLKPCVDRADQACGVASA